MKFLLLFLASYLCGVFWLYVYQRKFIYVPDTTRPVMAGLKQMSAVTADGLVLTGWYQPPVGDKPVIAMFHGNGGNVSLRQFKVPLLTATGYGVLLAEYRGYGANPGTPSEQGLYEDARAFLKALALPPERVVLYGESLGTGVAVRMAAENPGVRALVLEAPYTSMTAVAQTHMPLAPVFLLLKDRYPSIQAIKKVRAPVLILHGTADLVVPYRFGKKLFEAANEPKKLETFPGGGHLDLYNRGAAGRILVFLEHLEQPAELLHNAGEGD